MEENKSSAEKSENGDEKLYLSDVIQRFNNLQRWQTSIHPPYSSKQEDGQWVRWEDIQKILSNVV